MNNKQITGKIVIDAKKVSTELCFKNSKVRLVKSVLAGLVDRNHLKEE